MAEHDAGPLSSERRAGTKGILYQSVHNPPSLVSEKMQRKLICGAGFVVRSHGFCPGEKWEVFPPHDGLVPFVPVELCTTAFQQGSMFPRL